MFLETQRLRTERTDIAYHHLPAEADTRGILLISHGLSEHSKRYDDFARFMAGRRYHVYAHDHRGHGETKAEGAPLGRFARRSGVAHLLDDVAAMRDHALSRHPGLPVVLFGHSMGGVIALNCAVTHPDRYDAVAVFNSNLRQGLAGKAAKAVLLTEKALKGSDMPSTLMPRLTFTAWGRSIEGYRTDFDWLSSDAAEVDRYLADPLCGYSASVGLWLDLVEMSFRPLRPAHLARLPKNKPLYLVGGGRDPATRNGKSVVALSDHLKRSGFSRIDLRIYPQMRHETLKEYGREHAMEAFADWCDGAVAGVAR